jgi:hypothetical protein
VPLIFVFASLLQGEYVGQMWERQQFFFGFFQPLPEPVPCARIEPIDEQSGSGDL